MANDTGDAPVTVIRNIGPAQAGALSRAGIRTADQLRKIGAHDAYRRLLDTGIRPHFIGYYALVMALQGRPWNDCKGREKDDLRRAFDALVAERQAARPGPADDAIEAILDRIGTGPRRAGR